MIGSSKILRSNKNKKQMEKINSIYEDIEYENITYIVQSIEKKLKVEQHLVREELIH